MSLRVPRALKLLRRDGHGLRVGVVGVDHLTLHRCPVQHLARAAMAYLGAHGVGTCFVPNRTTVTAGAVLRRKARIIE